MKERFLMEIDPELPGFLDILRGDENGVWPPWAGRAATAIIFSLWVWATLRDDSGALRNT